MMNNIKFNRSDYILLSIVYGITIAVEIYDYALSKNKLIEYLVDIPITIINSIFLIFIFTSWLIPNYIIKRKKYVQFVLIGLFFLIATGSIEYIINFWSGDGDWEKLLPPFRFITNSLSIGSDAVALPLGLLLTKKFYEEQVVLAKARQREKENELKLLRSQIDPHFLFNNLNTLDSLIDSDTEKAKEYINRLSLIYRYLIKTKDAEVMELYEERQFAENYIFLIKTRFGDDYDFKIDQQTTITDKFIPTGAIQTLLENVVKHNKPDNDAIKTVISITDTWLKVTNTKSTMKTKNESLGTGLENLKTRYRLLSEKEISIINTEKEFTISIPIIKLIL